MNWILSPIRNGREMTRVALRTFLAQDIGDVGVLFIANSPEDGTMEMLSAYPDPRIHVSHHRPPLSVAASWNYGLHWIWKQGAQYACVVNNDVELHPQTYRLLVEDGGPFVTAVGVKEREKYEAWSGVPIAEPKRPHPDFSCFLIRRETWDKVGPFDELCNAYTEDSRYHVRMHRRGIAAYCIDLPFLHHACGTIKNSPSDVADRISVEADRGRKMFQSDFGCLPGTHEYEKLFDDSTFGMDSGMAKW